MPNRTNTGVVDRHRVLTLGLFIDDEALDPERMLADLSPAECEQYARQQGGRRRRRYLASRWLVRRHLADELDLAPRAIGIIYPAGRPPVCPDTPLKLGLSHSGSACLSLLGRPARVGCDIEHVRARRFAPERLAAHHFDPDEVRALHDVPAADRLTDFHRLWTLKEAQLKALGLGLGAGLARPAFALRPRLRCVSALTDGPWFFGALDLELPAGRFALAIAASCRIDEIRLARFQPAGPSGLHSAPIPDEWHTSHAPSPT